MFFQKQSKKSEENGTKNIQRNKYLDELGIPVKEYGVNFMDEDDPRQEAWAKEREEYGFDERETWVLNTTFVEWLYSHLKMYVDVCNVDLSFYKFNLDGEEYTHGEAIDFILERCVDYLKTEPWSDDEEKAMEGMYDACRMWAEILPAMWW